MSTAYLKEIQLPSKGFLYGQQIPDGMVSIEPMGTKEEKLFSAGSNSAGTILNKIYESCVTCPIPLEDLVLGDRLYVLLQLRSISYDNKYFFSYKCESCGNKSEGCLDLDNLDITTPNEELEDPSKFLVDLPILGNTLEVRLLTGRDEDQVRRYVKQLNSKVPGQGTQSEYIYRLARRIVSIDGDSKIGIREAMEFVEGIKGRDSLALRDAIVDHDIGPSMQAEPDCQHCGYPNGPLQVTFESEFFRPRRRRSSSGEHLRTAESVDAAQTSQLV